MTSTLSLSLRRALAGLILLAILSIAWSGLIAPVLDLWRDHGDQLAHQTRLLLAYRTAAAALPALEERARQLRALDAAQQGFLEGADATLAGAKLQSDVKQLIEANGGQVSSIQLLPPASDDGFQKLTVRLDFKSSTDGLPKITHAIEAGSPALFLDNALVRAPEAPGASGSMASPLELTVRWDVYGYFRKARP